MNSKKPPNRPPGSGSRHMRIEFKETAHTIDRRAAKAPTIEAAGNRPAPGPKPKSGGPSKNEP